MLYLRRKLLRTRVLIPLALLAGVISYLHPWRRPITIVERTHEIPSDRRRVEIGCSVAVTAEIIVRGYSR
jgi:hypothetical protein